MTTRIALIGAGRWGRRLLPALHERFDVLVCCTRGGRESTAWLAERFPELPRTTAYAEVVANDDVDVVVLATPLETHAELAAAALEARKHVFVEKPLTTSVADARALVELARNAGVVLFVGHIYLYDAALERLRQELGRDPLDSAWLSWRKLGTFDSDLFWNVVSHDVSTSCALAGAPVETAEVLIARARRTPCDLAVLRLGFVGGAEAVIAVDRIAPVATKSVAAATRGGAEFVWQDGVLHELRDGAFVESYRPTERPLDRELEAFRTAIEEDAPFPSDGAHGVDVVEVLERLRAGAGGVAA